ncbi:TfoX/Sxy family DNA transformation protein [Leptolyngbya iicbica]|uniref:Competence protein TfoX n=2 Tax=Cyanophyceae TaxID=3028117 RepID=A0A4Q7EEV0_9CYAN|nr:TfoX/Sxy family DNA transformation protein [Leptolyngbya sp. LK]RZM81722.1 competence protein TfoX [Leptolyngbya sp. LK]
MTQIRNVGKVSRQWLAEIEIYSLHELQACVSVAAFEMIRQRHPKVSLNLLWALEGAILDVDWRALSAAQKSALRWQLR